MIVLRTPRGPYASEKPTQSRRIVKLCKVAVPTALLAASFGAGVFAGRDGIIRERLKVSYYKLRHPVNFARALVAGEELPTIRIDMKAKHFLKIAQMRNEALGRHVLIASESASVPAQLSFDGESVPVRMRLKGILDDHRLTDKWSYRITLRDGHRFRGMRKFSIQHPKTRRFLIEWCYLETLRAEDVLAPRYGFANVIFNGTPKGIHAWEEHVAKELLEAQQRRDGVILKIDDTDIWRHRLSNNNVAGGSVFKCFSNNGPVEDYAPGRNERNPELRMQRDAAVRLLVDFQTGRRKASEVFNIEVTARFLAVHELWNADHPLGPPNARFYYDAITGKLEPIGGDCWADLTRGSDLVALRDDDGLSWAPRFLDDPIAAEAYVREVVRLSKKEYLEDLRARLQSQFGKYLRALHREYPEREPPWDALEERQRRIRANLNLPRTVVAYGQYHRTETESGASVSLHLKIGNVLTLPVEVLGIQVGYQAMIPARGALDPDSADPLLLEGRDSVVLPAKPMREPMRFAHFRVGELDRVMVANGKTLSVRIVTRVLGHSKKLSIAAKMGPEMADSPDAVPATPSLEVTLATHPFLTGTVGAEVLRLRPGEWEVTKDLVLPRGVAIEAGPGTILRFGPDVVFLCRGPMRFTGTRQSPIVLTSSGETWPGVVVLESDAPSTWTHVVVEKTRGIDRHGWLVTGGVTFYKSPAELTHCVFSDSQAEDGLNIVRAEFQILRCTFGPCVSDALDCDFSRGLIRDCVFNNVGGDAVDIGGSHIDILNFFAKHIGDKAISVGEDSHVRITGSVIEGALFGIVSKDLSTVTATDLVIRDTQIGMAAFIKKPEFGPATIDAGYVTMLDVQRPTLVQTGSQIVLNGRTINGSDVDIEQYYKRDAPNEH